MAKKKLTLFTNISKLPFVPKLKEHCSILIIAGVVLVFVGLALQARCFFQKQLQDRYSMNRVFINNNLSKYSPADVVDTIEYTDINGLRSGTISVLDKGNKSATCGYGLNNPCAFYWNVSERSGDTHLTPHLLLLRGFGDNSYKSMKLIDPATFEIKTEGGVGNCKSISTYTVKITGVSAWIISKDVETECYNSKGNVYSTERYSTTTIDTPKS